MPKRTRAVIKTSGTLNDMKTTSQISSNNTVSKQVKLKASTKTKVPAKTILLKKQTAKDLLSNVENYVPYLNTGTGYPVHPNRIWPD